jgi:membrane-associated PAP2 superfamily phosphatase
LGKKTLWFSLLALILVFAFFELTNTDVLIQQKLYYPANNSWFLKDPHLIYRKIFYTGAKILIYIIGVSAIVTAVISWKKNIWNDYRKGLIVVALSLIILPTGIALVGKSVTNVQCPDDLKLFGGKVPYVKHFEPYPPNPDSPDGKWSKGRCWPAGHASGGFALLGLVCLFKSRKNKIAAFIFAMSMGWVMGMYQLLRGVHFFSHHITTMFLAFIIVSTLNILIKDFTHESSPVKN